MSVLSIMTHRNKLVTTMADASLASLRDVFAQARFQHVPVIDSSNRVVGIVSVKDYFRELSPVMDSATDPAIGLFIRSRKVHQVMVTPVITVDETVTVKHAAAMLLQHNIGCLPVVDSQKHLLGLLSWKDIMRAALSKSSTPVEPSAEH